MISNLTEIIMCLHEETGDSTHERTSRGSWGLPPSLSSGLVEIIRALGISVKAKHLIKKASSAMPNLTKSAARFWKLRRKCTRDFVLCAD